MSINRAIENIFEGKLDEMRQNFSAAITSKAVEKLEERKIEIAENYFGQVDESDLPITKKKEKVYTYKHKTSEKEVRAVKSPGKDWKKIDEEEQLIELRNFKNEKDVLDYVATARKQIGKMDAYDTSPEGDKKMETGRKRVRGMQLLVKKAEKAKKAKKKD